MEFDLEPKLIEEATVSFMRRREEQGDFSCVEEYHSLADPIYEEPLEAREVLFKKLFETLFAKFGLMSPLVKAFNGFPQLEAEVTRAYFKKAPSDEGADIVRAASGADGSCTRAILIKVAPRRFAEPLALNKFLTHELMHVADLVDDSFGYSESLVPSRSELEPCIIDRYRIIWDIYIDSRLVARSKETISTRGARFDEFSSYYPKFPEKIRLRLFEALWAAEKLDHQGILAMAKEPKALLSKCEIGPEEYGFSEKAANLLPGSRCPLCNFPTYIWAEGISSRTAAAIQADFPGWTPERGACTRCAELYEMSAALGLPEV